jgi:hypothetical protein
MSAAEGNAAAAGGGGGNMQQMPARKVRVAFFGDNHENKICSIGISLGLIDFLSSIPMNSFIVVSETNGVTKCIASLNLPSSRILTEFPIGTKPFTDPELFTVAMIEYSKLFTEIKPEYTTEYYTAKFGDLIPFIDGAIGNNPNHPLLQNLVRLLQIVGNTKYNKATRNLAFIAFAREIVKIPQMKVDPEALAMWQRIADGAGLDFANSAEWKTYALGHAGRRDVKLFHRVKERVLAEPSIDKVAIVMGDSHLPNEMQIFADDPLFNVDTTVSKRWLESAKVGVNYFAAKKSESGNKKGGKRRTSTQKKRLQTSKRRSVTHKSRATNKSRS